MEFKRRKWRQRLFSAILVTGIIATSGRAVKAANEPGKMTEIISQAGNPEMKALGQAYLEGEVFTYVQSNKKWK